MASRPRRLVILGSTGSIGTQALDVVARSDGDLELVGLSASRDWQQLIEQAEKYGVSRIALADAAFACACNSRGPVTVAAGADIGFADHPPEERSEFREHALETLSLGISARSSSIRCDLTGTAYCKHGSQPILSLSRWLEALPRRCRSQSLRVPSNRTEIP